MQGEAQGRGAGERNLIASSPLLGFCPKLGGDWIKCKVKIKQFSVVGLHL